LKDEPEQIDIEPLDYKRTDKFDWRYWWKQADWFLTVTLPTIIIGMIIAWLVHPISVALIDFLWPRHS
jgi:hypothetical protein